MTVAMWVASLSLPFVQARIISIVAVIVGVAVFPILSIVALWSNSSGLLGKKGKYEQSKEILHRNRFSEVFVIELVEWIYGYRINTL